MRDLREVARGCLEAALRAVDPRRLTARALETVPLDGPVAVAAIGKAASGMAEGALERFPALVEDGLVVTPHGGSVGDVPAAFRTISAGHPLPDSGSVRAAERLRELAERSSADATLVLLLSGGASALVALPPKGVSLGNVQSTTDMLLRAGASIDELNTVRKHLDLLKGGRLARLSAASRVVALVLSDVVDDRLDVIASGPVSPDRTTFADAIETLRSRDLWERAPDTVREYLLRGVEGREEESPLAGDPCFRKVDCRVIGSNRLALEAALREAERAGFEARRLEAPLVGEARQAGRDLGRRAKNLAVSTVPTRVPVCFGAGGETTVTVIGPGKGGRNQEVALAAALEIAGEENLLVAAFATDGRDGPTDAAGAWVDGTTVERSRSLGVDLETALATNDAYPVFAALGDLIVTGPTGTNVMDLALVFAV